ncbi:Protein of unknown function [Pyronema omphalodes CBS 100304]|uniref:Uncharacterized protein n=1 Tax=Pyronema omphalodes (strain CBS 100304) TaxID=1076935 RepID=U4KWQ3_PYROM|nr:Protein of unknown function [Pyronema omphalodes CBS 100304]
MSNSTNAVLSSVLDHPYRSMVEDLKPTWIGTWATSLLLGIQVAAIYIRHVKEHTNGKVQCPFIVTGRCGKSFLFLAEIRAQIRQVQYWKNHPTLFNQL